MNPRTILDLFALLACSVYGTIPLFWLAVHPFVDRWRASGRRAYAFVVPVWGGFMGFAFALMWPFRSVHFYTELVCLGACDHLLPCGILDLPRGVPKIRPRPGFGLGGT